MEPLNYMPLEASLIAASPGRTKSDNIIIIHEPEEAEQESIRKYSGIKNSSRRLDLSRSMSNATNIINRLQERVRR